MPKLPTYFDWPGTVWLFSDPHFGHDGLLKFERTEFKDIIEHDSHILGNLKFAVRPTDTLVCLGDLGNTWEDKISQIQCAKKVLLLGNHDKRAKSEYRKYFDEVYSGPLFINKFFILSHEPIPVSEHFINIHGHLHSSKLDEDRYINISSKDADYKPIPLDKFYSKMDNLPKIRARFLEEWYADKYVFKGERIDVPVYQEDNHIIPQEDLEFLRKYSMTYRDAAKYKFYRSIALSLEDQLKEQLL